MASYDNLFIFDEVGWNFEPSEAALARSGSAQNTRETFGGSRGGASWRSARLLRGTSRSRPMHSCCRARSRGSTPAGTCSRSSSGLSRASGAVLRDFQEHMERNGVDTRMVWTGNALRQPAFKGVPHRIGPGGLPNADQVMEQGLVLPCNHGLTDDDIDYVCEVVDAFLAGAR